MTGKLTPAQLAMLRNAADGKPLTHGLKGASEHGGATWTRIALNKRGYLLHGNITAAGLAALKDAK